ncbi:MAG TPA: DUF2530 domain-containing protein [Jiangellaceae bacterium]|nr:DUF2530 domain-containing protein [Jiangellaceae bacterium]
MSRRQGRTHEPPPEVEPLDVDGVRTVAIITVLWAVAFVVLALQRAELEDAGRGWWLWTCLAGVGLGLLGLEYCRRRRDAIARAELEAEAEVEDGFDDVAEWGDGELAALAADDPSEADVDDAIPSHPAPGSTAQRGGATPPYDHPVPPHREPETPAPQHAPDAPAQPRRPGPDQPPHYGVGGRPPPGYVTGDFPVVPASGEPVSPPAAPPPAAPPRAAQPPKPPAAQVPDRPPYHHPHQPASPAGYALDPDRTRRHPRDEELARRYRGQQSESPTAGHSPPSDFLQDEPSSGEFGTVPPVEPDRPAGPEEPGPPPARPGPVFDSEFFSDEPPNEPRHGPEFLLDDDPDAAASPPERRGDGDPGDGPDEYRGRRARRD